MPKDVISNLWYNKNNKNKNSEQQRTKITNDNKNKDDDNDNSNKVSKISNALNSGINRLNTLEKSIQPPTKISVKECTASDITQTTTLSSAVTMISTTTQSNISKCIRMIIRDKTYSMVKFLKNDNTTSRIVVLFLDTKYVQKPIGWKK